ncbi:MAG: DUF2298 domain-containing protein [Lachnospiraceae bacterium]|nr:DUF2298 domain-containing protein [Lachnospiraceae bacterium]
MQTVLLSGSDAGSFLLWYAASVLLGLGFYPLGAVLFRHFDDRGWLFSKALGIGIGGYLVFVLGRFRILPFTGVTSAAVTAAAAVLCWLLFLRFGSAEIRRLPDWREVLIGEFFFLLVFLFWTWCSGFRPAASGTEKPMDYGFMAAMMRSTEIPAKDIWYSRGTINYYYGGQFYAVYLTKLTFTRINETYHLMRALVAAFCFSLSGSLVRQALKDRGISGYCSRMGGLFAALTVSFAGNVHYLVYGLFGSVFKPEGWEDYWFPASTRYIGHNPLTEDQCIHEFPSYSFVLGDLHAHVVNLFLVLVFIGLMYSWFQSERVHNSSVSASRSERTANPFAGTSPDSRSGRVRRIFSCSSSYIPAAGVLIGLFKWTNYWDFIIYFTVFLFTSVCIFFRRAGRESSTDGSVSADSNKSREESSSVSADSNKSREESSSVSADSNTCRTESGRVSIDSNRASAGVCSGNGQRRFDWILQITAAAILVYLLHRVIAWPFTSQFDSMFKGVAAAQDHTAFYQLLILWGVPVLTAVLLAAAVLKKKDGTGRSAPDGQTSLRNRLHEADVFFVMLSVCGIGLVLIPELVYVRDIYEQGYARSNTMFKLTYQAFVMLGLVMSYAFFRILCLEKKRLLRIPAAICAGIIFLTFGYGGYAVQCWYGNIFDRKGYQGLDAEAYLETEYPEDAAAIRWLEEHVTGQPVVLEVPGDSYSDRCRVSAMTGLPTPEGWYVHEWLWRDDPEDLDRIKEEIREIYTGTDQEQVKLLLEKYEISYIFIGSCEREEYGEELNEELLRTLGEVCFDGEEQGIEGGAWILQVPDPAQKG